MQLFYSVSNHLCPLLPFWIGTLILLFFKKGRGLKFVQVAFSNFLEEGEKHLNLISNLVSSCIIILVPDPHPPHYLTLVHYFQYFMVLGWAHHSCKIHWAPLWVFILCFISISFFPLDVCEASCQKKFSADHLIRVSCVEWLICNNSTKISMSDFPVVFNIWSLIE